MPSAIFLIVTLWTHLTAAAPAPRAILQLQPPAPVALALRLTDGRRHFRPGEIIAIELAFSSATPKRFTVDGATYDRSGRLTIDELAIDRIDDVSDPMLDYFGSIGGYVGGGIRGIGALGEKPVTVRLELNEWFRFDKPGMYTLAVTSRRVTDEAVSPPAVVPVESNSVSFEILPRDAAWEASQLETARRIVDANRPPLGARPGCRMMRFLGTEAAAMEMMRRYGAGTDHGCDFEYMVGLFGAANRAAIVRAMEEGLRAVDQPVTGSYLRTLSTLSVYLQHLELRPAQTRENRPDALQPAGLDPRLLPACRRGNWLHAARARDEVARDRCWRVLNQIADLRMTPVVQTRAIGDLDNPDPDAVIAAIQTLGRHGSPAALEPLRTALQRWARDVDRPRSRGRVQPRRRPAERKTGDG